MSATPPETPARALRNAFGRYATGIAVITTKTADGRFTGVTVNSFGSVSLDPPLIQFSLGRQTNSLQNFERETHFMVNVLAQHQKDLSSAFTKPAMLRWDDIPHRVSEKTGCPVLVGTLATFDCERHAVVDAGDHRMFIGKVLDFQSMQGAPLLYFQGAYCTVVRDDAFPGAADFDEILGSLGWGA